MIDYSYRQGLLIGFLAGAAFVSVIAVICSVVSHG